MSKPTYYAHGVIEELDRYYEDIYLKEIDRLEKEIQELEKEKRC
jgi:hypothetical protein